MEKLGFEEQRDGLLRSIEQDQEDVRGAVRELTSAARSTIDVRAYIRESPLAWVMGGVLLGAWMGSRRLTGGS